jgi:transcriptional regulator with XRE-family HTH domain
MSKAAALIIEARRRSSLSQEELAERAGTSRTAVSAYEAGAKDPRAETVERLLDAAGYRLELVPTITWSNVGVGRKTFSCPSALPHLETARALASVELPHHLAWSGRTTFALADRHDRQRVYEIVLTEGLPGDIESVVDGALLADGWDDLYLRKDIRAAWQPLIDRVRSG